MDLSIRLWNVTAGDQTAALHGHSQRVAAVDWNGDGTRLASASEDGSIILWDVATGEQVRTVHSHSDGEGKAPAVLSVAWSPDGHRIASASHDGTLRVWDGETGDELLVLRGHRRRVWQVCWSPDSARLASAGVDSTVRIWDVIRGCEASRLEGNAGERIQSVAWSPDGKLLASAAIYPPPGDVKIWSVDSGGVRCELRGRARSVTCLRWSPDGLQLATGSQDQTVRLWDPRAGVEIGEPFQHTGPVTSIDWNTGRDHPRLAAGSNNGSLRVWDATTRNLTLTLRTSAGGVAAARWSPDGTRLAATGGESVYVWDASVGYRSQRRGVPSVGLYDR